MTEPVLLLILLDFASVGLLGAAFFRRGGRPGLKWWATVLPIMLCPVLLVAAYAAGLTPLTPARWPARPSRPRWCSARRRSR